MPFLATYLANSCDGVQVGMGLPDISQSRPITVIQRYVTFLTPAYTCTCT